MKEKSEMREILGYVFLAFSLLAWTAIALLPFMDISKAQIVGATTFLIIVGELLFWAPIVLLGKERYGGKSKVSSNAIHKSQLKSQLDVLENPHASLH